MEGIEKDPEQHSNSGTGEVTMATTDSADDAITNKKSAFSPSRPTAVVNRLKTLLANMKTTHTEKPEGENVSMATGRISPTSTSSEPIPAEPDVSDRPKVPLKQRSFLNPFLELTAAAQGTTAEEVKRSSPDLFENVTVKLEMPDHSDQCSRSSGHSGLSDKDSNAQSISTCEDPAGNCSKGQWSREMAESESVVPSAEISLEDKTMADSEENAIDLDPNKEETNTKEKEVELGNCLSNVVDGDSSEKPLPGETEVTMCIAQPIGCDEDSGANLSKSITSILDFPGKNYSDNPDKELSAIPETCVPISNTIVGDSPTNSLTAVVNELNVNLSNQKSDGANTSGSLMETSGMEIANEPIDVAMPNQEQDQNKENGDDTCGIADGKIDRSGSDVTMPNEQDKQMKERISGRDGIGSMPSQEQDKPKENEMGGTAEGGIDEDSLKRLKEKFPLLWEAAGGEADENIGGELKSEAASTLPVEISSISQTSSETKKDCGLVGLDGSHDDVNLKENAIEFDDAVSDGTLENQAITRLEKPEDTLVPEAEDRHGESDSSNGKISKVSISDGSYLTVVDDDISRTPSTAGSGRSTGTGGNLIVEQPGSSDLVVFPQDASLGSSDCKSPPGGNIKTALKSHLALDLKDSGDSLSVGDVPILQETENTKQVTGAVEHVMHALDSTESDGGVPKNTHSNKKRSDSLNDSSDFLSIKIADVKSMNVEEFEKVDSPTGEMAGWQNPSVEARPRPSPTPSDGAVITVFGASGPSDNFKTNDVIVKCKYMEGKYHCLLCSFSITFSTSFAVHLHKHLHKLNQVCTVCFPAESSPKSVNDSPFNITCPVVKSTMDALERTRQKESQYLLPKLIDSHFAAVSPLSLSSFTPTENILEPNYPGSDLTVIKKEVSGAHISLVRGSTESEEDCVVISRGVQEGEPGSANQVIASAVPSFAVDLAPSDVSRAVSTEVVAATSKPIIDMSDIPTALPMSQFQRSMSTYSAVGSGNIVTAHQLTEEMIILNIAKLENSKGFYTCGFPRCNFSTTIESNLGTHNVVSHSFERSFPCVYCGHTFDEGDSLLVHMKGHHNASKMFQLFRCCFRKCKFCSNNSNAFKQHIEIMHAMETQFKCIFCKENVSSDDELIRHLNENLLKLTQCPYCHVRSPSRPQVLQHIKRQHPNEVRRVTVTSKTICSDTKKVSNSMSATGMPGGSRVHVCSACQYKTTNTGKFRKHLVSCEKAKNFHAMMASSSESPSQASSLGDTEYALPRQESISDRSTKSLCDYADPSLVDRNAEDTSDTELDSPYPIFACSACKLTYKSNAELAKHIRENHYSPLQKSPGLSYQIRTPSPSPTKETRFLCDKCGSPFKDRKSLQRHRTDFHFIDSDSIAESVEETDDLMMRCPKCVNFGTRTMSAFKRHMLKHPGKHVTASKMCRLCQYMAQSKEAILLHYSEKHSDVTNPEIDNMKLIFYGERAACPICDFTCTFEVEPLVGHMMKLHSGNHSALKQALEQLPDDSDEQSVEVGRKIDEKFLCQYCDAKFEHLSTFLRHVQLHFSGEEQFIIFKCSCCHYQSDRKGLVLRHMKKKHAGVIRPPDYIRYVMLKGKLGLQHRFERELSQRDRRVEELESSSHQGQNSPALFGEMEDQVMDTASDLYENPGFEPRDDEDSANVGDALNAIGGFLTPAVPEQYIKVEPVEEAETAVHEMTIERYHCDYCQFSSGIMEEFENHRCADPNSALEMPGVRDRQQATPAPEEYEASSSSDAAEPEDEDIAETFSYHVTSRKVGNEWECVECGYKSQHRNKIQRHYRYKHHSKKPYICGYCNFSAVENGHVRRHCRNMHPGRPVSVVNSLKADQEEMYPDTQDERNLPSDLDNQISQLGPYMFQCNICQYTSETHHLIERHVLCVHFKFHKYECKFCTYTAAEKGKIIKHGKLLHKGNVGFSIRKFDAKSKVPSKGASAALGSPRGDVTSMPEQNFTPPAAVSLKRKLSSKSCSVTKKAKLDDDDEETVLKALTKLYTEVRANIIQTGESERFFRCTACTYVNDQKWCVVRHVSEKHPESNDFDLVAESHRRTDQKKRSSCNICGQASAAYFDIKKHVLAVHFQYGIYNCKYCPTRLHSKFKMAEHVRMLHASESQEIIEYPDPLNKVNNKMDKFCTPKKQSDGKYKCLFCPFTRPYAKYVEQHLKKVHLNYINPYKCLYCGYSAKCKDSVRAHHYKWHINEYFTVVIVRAPGRSALPSTPVESSPSSSNISETTLFSTSKRKRENSESSSVSSTPKKLMKYVPGMEAEQLLHEEEGLSEKSVKVASPPKKVKPKIKSPILKVRIGPKVSSEKSEPVVDLSCRLCGKMMSGDARLKTHLMMHLDYRPYSCTIPQCSGRFIEISGVRKHCESIHQKPEKYQYIPNDEMELKVSRLMSGDKPVDLPENMKRCNQSEPKLKSKIKLEPDLLSGEVESEPVVEDNVKRGVHFIKGELGSPEVVRQNGNTLFKCPHCPQTCKDRSNCIKHIRRHGPRNCKREYKCCYCNFLGLFPSNVKEHWKYKHEKASKPFAFIKVDSSNEKSSEQEASSSEDSDSESPEKKARVEEEQSPQRKEEGAATKQYKPPSKARNYALVRGPLGEPYQLKRNKRTVFCCPHCDHQTESRANCNRHIQLHGPKIFKCKYCDYIYPQVPEVTKHCIRIHGKNGIVRLSAEKAIAMEENQLRGCKESSVPESSSVETPPQKQDVASDNDSAKIAWIVQKLGWPRVHKSSKQGISNKKKWRCPFCPYFDTVKTVVVRHMESHMKEKYSGCNRDNHGASQDDELYASVIKKFGRPKLYRSGAGFSKRYRCPRCSFSLKTKCGVLKHMTSHLDEMTPRSGQKIESHTLGIPSDASLASSSKQCTSDNTTVVQSGNVLPLKRIRKRDGTVTYKCQSCTYESEVLSNARIHNIRHGPKRYKCAYCDFRGFFGSEITRHGHGPTHPNKPARYLKIETNAEVGVSVEAGTSVSVSNDNGTAVSNAKATAIPKVQNKRYLGEFPVNKVTDGGKTVLNCPKCSYSTENNKYYRKHFRIKHLRREVDSSADADSSAVATSSAVKIKKKGWYLGELPVNKVTEGGRTVLKCPKCVYSTENNKYYRKHFSVQHILREADSSAVKMNEEKTQPAQKRPVTDASKVRFQCDRTSGFGIPCGITTVTLNEMKRHHYHRHRGRKLKYKIIRIEDSRDEAATKMRRCDLPIPPLPDQDVQGVYHCTRCSYDTAAKAEFQLHWKGHVQGYTCTICGAVQYYPSHIERHIKRLHKEMDYEKFVLDNAKDALEEMETARTKEAAAKTAKQPAIQIERQAVYKCTKCTHTSFSELDHALHLSLHSSPKKKENSRNNKMAWTGWSPRPWECGYCSKGFFAYSKAKSHWSNSHSELPMKIVQYDEKSGNRTPMNALRSPISPRTRTNSGASGTSYGTNPSKGSNSELDSNTSSARQIPNPDATMDRSDSEGGHSEGKTPSEEKPTGVETVDSDDEGAEVGCEKEEENLWNWDEPGTEKNDEAGEEEEVDEEEEEVEEDEEVHVLTDDYDDDGPDDEEGDGNEEEPDNNEEEEEPANEKDGGDDGGADENDMEGHDNSVNEEEPDGNDAEPTGGNVDDEGTVGDNGPDDNDDDRSDDYVDKEGPKLEEAEKEEGAGDNRKEGVGDLDEDRADRDDENVDDNIDEGVGDNVGEDRADNDEADADDNEAAGNLSDGADDTESGAVVDETEENGLDGIADERTEATNEVKVINGFDEVDSANMNGEDVDEDFEGGWTIVSKDDESPLKCDKSEDINTEKSGCFVEDVNSEMDIDCADVSGVNDAAGDKESEDEEPSQLSREMNSSGHGSPGDISSWMILDEVSDDEAQPDMAGDDDIFS